MPDAIPQLMEHFNDGWTRGRIDDITPLLHPDVIFVAPDGETEIAGRDACLQTIKDYVSAAQTRAFEVRRRSIRTWGRTGVVIMDYTIEYTLNGESHKEQGREHWALQQTDGAWQIVWRAMVQNQSGDAA